MLQQRFEDYGLTGCIASEKAADRLKAQANATPALQAQQQPNGTRRHLPPDGQPVAIGLFDHGKQAAPAIRGLWGLRQGDR